MKTSVARAFMLSTSVILAVYLTGFIVTLVYGLVSLVLYAVGFDGSCNQAIGFIGCLLQCAVVAVVTIRWCVSFKLNIKHILISVPITAALFLFIERCFFSLHALNLPWSMLIFPQVFKSIELKEVTVQAFIDNQLYLLTTAILTTVNSVLMVLSWGFMRLKNKYNKKYPSGL